MARFIKSTSNLSPKVVWDTLSPWEDCPWVILGNVFATVNFSGNESWMGIVEFMYKNGQSNFAVLSGRHGDQLGQQVHVKNGKFLPRDASSPGDSAIDPEGDRKSADELRQKFNNKGKGAIHIDVVDVGNGQHDSVDLLTKEIKAQMGAGKVVILAWCYSLYAMKDGWDVNVKNAWPQVFSGANMVPISHTAKDWDWTKTYPQLPAVIAADGAAIR